MSLPTSKSEIIKHRPLRLLVERLQRPSLQTDKKQKEVYIDIDDVRKHLKESWRSGNKGNNEFGKPAILKNKMLTNWEIQRIGLSKRSYSTPKGSKGYKFDAASKQFVIKDEMAFHSKPFQNYLAKIQEEYEDKRLKVDSNRYKTEQRLEKMSINAMKFSQSSNYFGCLTKNSGFNTLKSFKSQSGFKSKF